jgi:hypothetical protein
MAKKAVAGRGAASAQVSGRNVLVATRHRLQGLTTDNNVEAATMRGGQFENYDSTAKNLPLTSWQSFEGRVSG